MSGIYVIHFNQKYIIDHRVITTHFKDAALTFIDHFIKLAVSIRFIYKDTYHLSDHNS
jgi:hypothetical protein